jgi:ATP-binding cassette subfamily F protein uup
MALVGFQDVSVAFGGPLLLDHAQLQVEKGERVALIGRNGEGKTTLLRLVAGDLAPDSGMVTLQKGIRVAGLTQDLPQGLSGSVREVITSGNISPKAHEVDAVLTRLGLEAGKRFESLSVGYKRKTLLAGALVADPDLLLLDEPTNHLDMTTITWLEGFLQKFKGTLIFITHDRVFLQKLATRIVELDRGQLSSWACDYRTFLERRDAAFEAEQAQRDRFMRKLAAEEAWIRQGIKARRTRNEGRVRALIKMRAEQQALRVQAGSVKFQIEEARRTGRLVIEADGITHAFGPKTLIQDFSIKIMRGDRIGIIGPNGIGKTTLLRILLGELPPQNGDIRHGTRLQPIYFDQLRAQLDENRTVQENIADGEELLDLNGSRRHVIGYLKDFLFTPDRARSPVHILSGGERNRLLLARLFSRPSNVLVLDVETLELLEERLLDYSGTILLVSHDRAFLNAVVTSTLVFEENGRIIEYAGGYDDWLDQRQPAQEKKDRESAESKAESPPRDKTRKKERPRKLTFNETRELEKLPRQIETLEAEQKSLVDQMAAPEFYKQAKENISRANARLAELETALEQAYARWQALESIR